MKKMTTANWASTDIDALSTNTTDHTSSFQYEYRVGLVFIYWLVLLGGSLGIGLMSTNLKSNISFTTVSVINLLMIHLLFLLTVPFRIYYFISNHWALGSNFCKVVSSMIHAHMYLSFIFYVVILTARYVAYFELGYRLEFYRVLHAVIASVTLWVIILGSALPVTVIKYGHGKNDSQVCFDFGHALQNPTVIVLNYIISTVVILIWAVLALVQLWILWRVHRKYGQASLAHQEFRVQIKSLCFVLIMFLCFVLYHAFRLYYVSNYWDGLQKVNEVFLALTTFSCLDMLVFVGKGVWQSIFSKCLIILGKTRQP